MKTINIEGSFEYLILITEQRALYPEGVVGMDIHDALVARKRATAAFYDDKVPEWESHELSVCAHAATQKAVDSINRQFKFPIAIDVYELGDPLP
jgi:hypothetical protein